MQQYQQVRFVNPKYKEVVFNKTPPFIFERIIGTGAADVQLITHDPVGQHGKVFSGLYQLDREITVWVHIKGSTLTAMYENRAKLTRLLNPLDYAEGALGRLEYTNAYGTRWIPAAVKQGPQAFTKAGPYFKSIPLVFYCPDALWRSMRTEALTLGYLGGGLRFPLRLGALRFGRRGWLGNILNQGDSPSPMIIEITGPALRPEIRKVQTDEYVRLRQDKALYAGDILRIDTTPGNRRVTIQRAGGDTENAIGYVDQTTKWFQLDPGETVLRYYSGDDGQTSRVVVSTVGRYGGH